MSIAEYFGLLQPLWDELATYNPLPNCTCGKCTCNLGVSLQTRLDEDRLQDFLFGVNVDLYGHLRSSILAQEPLPPLDRVYQMFLEEERLQSSTKLYNEQTEIRAMAVKSNSPRIRTDGDRNFGSLFCSYCNRRGHDEAHCWAKHGYPEGYEPKSSRGGGRTSNRGGRNHFRTAGRDNNNHRGRYESQPIVATVASGEALQGSDSTSSRQHTIGNFSAQNVGLNSMQWQKLFDLFG